LRASSTRFCSEDLELDLAVKLARPLIERDHRARGGIVAPERGVAFDPAGLRWHALLHRPRRQEGHWLGHDVAGERAQGRHVVDDPDAAPVRGEHEVMLARLQLQVAHCHRRELLGRNCAQ